MLNLCHRCGWLVTPDRTDELVPNGGTTGRSAYSATTIVLAPARAVST
jgi:hypothetical protein